MKFSIILLVQFIFFYGFSQTQVDTTKSIILDEIVVSSQRFAKSKRKITQQIESISKKEIELQNFQNSADALANSGALSVQKSQQGGGSPVIRGFESSRILLLVDGIRMNNLIYRSGHLQNIVTVDKNMLEKIDVLFGPSSTIYGSDALGGAIYLQTKNAKLLSETDNRYFTGNIISNYNSINNGKSTHLDFNLAGLKWASLTSISFNDYGDLKMGKHKNGSNDYFGERPFYIATINGVDTQVANYNKYLQKFSGYKQYDFMQKFVYQQNIDTKHILNLQYSTSSDIPRYDRLTDLNSNGKLKSAVWNYGPQKRLLTAYKVSKENIFFDSNMNLVLSYQNIEESRVTRNFGSLDLTSRIEKVSIFGINADFKTKIGNGDFIYGADIYYDKVNSKGIKKNILTNLESATDSRYPDGKNNTLRAEGFVSYNNNLSKTASYNASARAGYTLLNSEIKTNFLNLPFTTIQQKNFTYSGAIGIVNNASEKTKVAFNLASAFRVPNIDDLSKIFESAAGTLIVPNKNLKPEKSITADISITFWEGKRFQFENTFYYTRLFDAIVTNKFILNNQSALIYEGENSQIFANQNQGKANITGVFSSLKAYITKSLLFYGSFNFTHGRVQNNSGEFPLDHIAPIYGRTGLKYESKLMNIDFNMLYNSKKELRNYSPSGEDNLQYAPKNGSPAWHTYNLKGSCNVINSLIVFTGIENILDTQYRTFASGINAGGRNFYLGGKYNF